MCDHFSRTAAPIIVAPSNTSDAKPTRLRLCWREPKQTRQWECILWEYKVHG